MKHLVTYCDRNPLDPQDRYTIKRAYVEAETAQKAKDIIADCDCDMIDVFDEPAPGLSETIPAEIENDSLWLEEVRDWGASLQPDNPISARSVVPRTGLIIDTGAMMGSDPRTPAQKELDDIGDDWTMQSSRLAHGAYDYTLPPSDMPEIDMEKVKEIPF